MFILVFGNVPMLAPAIVAFKNLDDARNYVLGLYSGSPLEVGQGFTWNLEKAIEARDGESFSFYTGGPAEKGYDQYKPIPLKFYRDAHE